MSSKYLPEGFDKSKPVGIIAGQGEYPIIMVERMRTAGVPVRLIAFEGETRDELCETFAENERVKLHVGQIGKMLKAMKSMELGYAVMAGQITPKRLFKDLKPDLKAVSLLVKLKEKNAETIFGALAREIEGLGITLLDARAFLDGEMAENGVMTGGKLKLKEDIVGHGVKMAKEVAALDIGQGVVVRNGTVLAVEAFEGTDAMLKRAGEFAGEGSTFIKTVKPSQDYRFDVPVFGEKTIAVLDEAGIKYAGLESGNVIILNKAKVIKAAKERGIVLFGY